MIVVTGATGNVGRPLVRALAAAGEQVTAVSRRPSPEPMPDVMYRSADLADPMTLKPALDGAEALFLLIGGAGEGIEPDQLLEATKAAGVRRVVLLSSIGAGTRPHQLPHLTLSRIEEAVRRSGLDWTVLRAGGFASNTFAWIESIRTRQTVAAPFGDIDLPVIDPVDIAQVAAAVLRDPNHAGKTYDLTGPQPISPREQAEAIGAAIGTALTFTEVSSGDARAMMLQFMPEAAVDGTLAIIGDPLPAEQRVSGDVERVVGRAPRTFAEWARRNAGVFRP